MAHLLRKVSFSKWELNKQRIPSNYTADAMTGCTRTQKNTLSVWESQDKVFSSPEVIDLIVALAITMERPDSIDLVWLDSEYLASKGIQISQTDGLSKFQAINTKHRDLSNLDYAQLAIVAEHIVTKLDEVNAFKKIGRHELLLMVDQALNVPGKFTLEDLSEKWQSAILQFRSK